MMQHEFEANFGRGTVAVTHKGRDVFSGLPHGTVFVLPTVPTGTTAVAAAVIATGTWHRRFNHINNKSLQQVRRMVEGMEGGPPPTRSEMCDPCACGKQARAPFPTSRSGTKTPLELIHTNVCGRMPDASIGGARFFVTITDDKTGWKSALPIMRKSDAAQVLMDVFQELETRQGRKAKAIRRDNGGEYLFEDFKTWLRVNGIQHQLTTPYTPQQNGVAERYNRTLMERVVTMLADAGLHKLYWGEALMAAN
eukprot:contig_17141_g4172